MRRGITNFGREQATKMVSQNLVWFRNPDRDFDLRLHILLTKRDPTQIIEKHAQIAWD